MIKSIIRRLFSSLGYSIHKLEMYSENVNSDINSMSAGLNRIKNLGIIPSTIIDIGAAKGTWTQKALDVWPSAKLELIEPLSEQKINLELLKKLYPKIDYHMAVAGESAGEIWMN